MRKHEKFGRQIANSAMSDELQDELMDPKYVGKYILIGPPASPDDWNHQYTYVVAYVDDAKNPLLQQLIQTFPGLLLHFGLDPNVSYYF